MNLSSRMGAAKSAARSESAREVLSRRSAVGAGRKQGERANENQSRMKPIFKEYNRFYRIVVVV